MANLTLGHVSFGPSKTLTDAHFLFFSAVSGDTHPIHYDVEYAAQTRFGRPLAHGLLLASLTALGAASSSDYAEGLVFIEQGCRFLGPVVVGDTITPSLTVEQLWSEGKREFVRFATKLTNQREEIVLQGFHTYQRVRPPVTG
jgi:acyl dehydratase